MSLINRLKEIQSQLKLAGNVQRIDSIKNGALHVSSDQADQ